MSYTVCPHGPLWAPPAAYCREHDLVDCPMHEAQELGEDEVHSRLVDALGASEFFKVLMDLSETKD